MNKLSPEDQELVKECAAEALDWGNDYLAALFLSTWSGMTTEEDVPLPTE